MKRFIVSVLCVSVFFIGIGSMVDMVGAKLKSDPKALEIISKARMAIGGDAALAEVRSMVIVGRSTHTLKIEGVEKVEQGETQIAMQFPNRLTKMVKIGNADGIAGVEGRVVKESNVFVMRKDDGETLTFEGKDGEFTTEDGRKIVVRTAEPGSGTLVSPDGKKFIFKRGEGETGEFTTEDGSKVIVRSGTGTGEVTVRTDGTGTGNTERVIIRRGAPGDAPTAGHSNELLKTALMLLLKAPEGVDVSYSFEGEGNIDGTSVNIVAASYAGAVYRLHIDKFTDLPVAFGYSGRQMPQVVRFGRDASEPKAEGEKEIILSRQGDGFGANADMLVKLSDYRSTGGVQLPYRWSTTTGGRTTEIFDVTSYEVNPANIAERFSGDKVKIRMERSPEK